MSDLHEKAFFSEFQFFEGAWVGHPVHGQGKIIATHGRDRTVDFEYHEVKRADELSDQELAELQIDDASTLISVDWIRTETKVVRTCPEQVCAME
jgi:hypothetical protein